MTLALFAVTVSPTLIEVVGSFARSPHASFILAIVASGYLKLILVLPLVLWFLSKLPFTLEPT